MADGGGIEPLSSFPLFYATDLEDLCGDTTHYNIEFGAPLGNLTQFDRL